MNFCELLPRQPGLTAKIKKLAVDPDQRFPLFSAKIKLTWRCNLRCVMCGIRLDPNREQTGPDCLGPELVKQTMQQLKDAGLHKIHFSGGEIFVYEHFREIIEFAARLGVQINITTNGTLLTSEIAKFLVEQRVHRVNVSVDGASAGEHDRVRGVKGAWKATWKGIDKLRERKRRKGRGPRIAVNTVVTSKNIDSLEKLYRILKDNEIDSWRLLPVDSADKKMRPTAGQWRELAGKWHDWLDLFARLPLDWSSPRSADRAAKGKFAGLFYNNNICFAPWFNLFIDADGKVYPCCTGKSDIRPYGNILERNVSDLLTGEGAREVRLSMASAHPYPICDMCDDFLEENRSLNKIFSA